ncbi:hypothetical protein WMY93_014898 [Mugilogobius chulae]|uniref:GRF-type domain-containing protein n=1 Tax=Mugilogobius chulae TaxID=88201 RepID=A0AAW0NWU2_9GOBI
MENCESLGIELVLHEKDRPAPCCPHGPTLLFEKICEEGAKGRRFYACSACRDRKDCNFFQWEDEKVSEARRLAREEENKSKMPPFTHKQYCARLKKFADHSSHRLAEVTSAQLKRPSVLLRPLENKKSNAQYLFADRSANFLLDTLVKLGFNKVLCVGTPRLHELIKLRTLEKKDEPIKSLLLDIDFSHHFLFKYN